MIVEERSYSLQPGRVADFFALYESMGREVQWRLLGEPLGYFASEIGELDAVVSLWGYADLAERGRRRSLLFADPTWLAYAAAVSPLILRMENRILAPAPFSPLAASRGGG